MPLTTSPPVSAIACRATRTTNQSITTDTWTAVAFDGETWDTGSLHSTVTNNSRITVPVAGKYVVQGLAMFAGGSTGTARYIALALNGSRILQAQADAPDTNNYARNIGDILNLAANDYLELHVYQATGGNLNVVANAAYLSVAFVGT